jgi:hypothetical protein
MRFYLFLGLLLVGAAGFYWIWQDANGLVLVEQAKDGFYHSYTMDGEKTKTGFSFDFLRQDQGIYAYFAVPFALVFLLGGVIGSILGFLAREPIDGYDFEKVKQEAQERVNDANKLVSEAKEALKTAEKRAKARAEAAIQDEREFLAKERARADEERHAAIEIQEKAVSAVAKARTERTDALLVAENATRKKNAAYAAAERFKRKLEKSA